MQPFSSSVIDFAEEEGGNPQSGTTTALPLPLPLPLSRMTSAELTTRRCWDAIANSMSPGVKELMEFESYNIALVIHDCSLNDEAITAIRSPVSTCHAVALNVLRPTKASDSETKGVSIADKDEEAKFWLDKYSLDSESTDIFYGDEGFANILQLDFVNAVYIFVPAELQSQYVLTALKAKKHVLLKDLVSTPSKDYREQLECAKSVGMFIQFSTMFVHHYRVQSFLDCVCARNTFGPICNIDVILTINLNDLAALSVSLPLSPGEGCVRRLGRYCVLIASLILRACRTPQQATVLEHILDETSGEPLSALCRVEYSGGVVLNCQVVYSDAPTRQVLTVRSKTNKFATMTDFVLPHPDGLATYRVYDKEESKLTGKMDVIQGGECIDVPTGPPQNVTIWREFHQLCSSVERYGWSEDAVETREARILSESALQTKRILAALDESVQNNGAPIDIMYRPSHNMTDVSICTESSPSP